MYSTFEYLLLWFFLAYAFYCVLDFAYEEVNFKRRLGLAGLKVWHYNVGEYFTEVLHLCLLLFLIGFLMKFQKLAFQFANLGKSLDNCKGYGSCPFSLQYCSEHIQSALSKYLGGLAVVI